MDGDISAKQMDEESSTSTLIKLITVSILDGKTCLRIWVLLPVTVSIKTEFNYI